MLHVHVHVQMYMHRYKCTCHACFKQIFFVTYEGACWLVQYWEWVKFYLVILLNIHIQKWYKGLAVTIFTATLYTLNSVLVIDIFSGHASSTFVSLSST